MDAPHLLAGAGVPAARFPHAEQICFAEEKAERREGAEREDGPQPYPALQVLGFLPLPPEPAPSQTSLCPGTRQGLRPNPAPVPGKVLGQQCAQHPGNAAHEIPGGTGCSGWGAQDGVLGTGCSGHPILAAGPDLESGQSVGSWGTDTAPPGRASGAPLGSVLPALQLPHPAWSRQREGILGQEPHSPPRDPVLGVAVLAGLEEQGRARWASPHAAPGFGAKPLLLGFAWRGDKSSPPICWREGERVVTAVTAARDSPAPRPVPGALPACGPAPAPLCRPWRGAPQRPAFLLLPWAMKQSGTLGKGLTERVTRSQRDILFG